MKHTKRMVATCTAVLLSLTMGMNTFAASGYTVKPPANTESSLGMKGESGATVAVISYKTDSEPESFYIGLSTTWKDSRFEATFADQDAFFYGFTVNPMISAASLPTLTILNPYADDDETDTVSTKKIKIYQELNGKLTDVTKSFSVGKNDEDRSVFVTQTRKPGLYIIAEKAIDIKTVSPSAEKSDTSDTKTKKPTIKKESTTSNATSSKSDEGIYQPTVRKK